MYADRFLRKLFKWREQSCGEGLFNPRSVGMKERRDVMWQVRRLSRFWQQRNLSARLRVVVAVAILILFITPLRNALVPKWPHVYERMSTFRVISMYVQDWFFYVDTTPYTGSCDFVHSRLARVKMPKLEEMAVYPMDDWNRHMERIKHTLPEEEFDKLDKFKPSMTLQEQRYIMYAMLSATQAMTAFNITYLVRGGSLIGYWRHHGRMPWDEDVDILIDSKQWALARKVLSCLPNLQINLGNEYMWKLFHKDATLWKGEDFIKFPYVDLFLYGEDSDHVWPLTIWMKMITMRKEWALPPSVGIFEGWPIAIPNKPSKVLHDLYPGRIMSDCYSQIFHRRNREAVPRKERVYVPCSMLRGIYPLVVRTLDKGVVIEDRTLGNKILSTFNTTYRGFLE